MFSNLIFSINCVLPIFIIMLLGCFLKKVGILDDHTLSRIDVLVFRVALPVMLFKDMAAGNFVELFDLKFVAYTMVTTLVMFVAVWICASRVIKNPAELGVVVQGSVRGNFAFIGIPLIINILGGTGVATLVITFVVPLYNVLSVIALSAAGKGKNNISTAIKNIVTNPLIIGIFIGAIFSILKIKLPVFINSSIGYVSSIATPLALISIGGSFRLSNIKPKLTKTLAVSFIKLVLFPLIFVPLAALVGFSGDELVVLFVMYGVPTAAASCIMASNMNGDTELAVNIVMMTTLLSVVTFTVGVYVLKTVGII